MTVDSDAHISWMLHHDDTIAFLGVKHSVFTCKNAMS